jgi:hypoxanthine phosphoribosyltransferase
MTRNDRLELLLSREQIEGRVATLAKAISADYQGRPLVLIGVLKGAFVFLADLVRQLDVPVELDFVRIASYGASQESCGSVSVTKEIELPLADKDVLIVEDIVDTGLSLRFLIEYVSDLRPASLKTCALLDKYERREIQVDVDYVGFRVKGGFIVGYGLDANERYRSLPDIYVLGESN